VLEAQKMLYIGKGFRTWPEELSSEMELLAISRPSLEGLRALLQYVTQISV
jgi:hypothetical protein